MSHLLRSRPATTNAMLAVFDDAATMRHALAFEAALARAEAAEGLIGADAADAIAKLCATIVIDPAELAEEAALAGTLAIPLVARLRAALPEAPARALHNGATSQDVADTVLSCQIRAASTLFDSDLRRVATALAALAQRHAATPSIGRTLLQDALPIGFGLRIAQWRAGIADAAERLRREGEDAARLQFGGGAGTRAGLGGKGGAVAARLAAALDLPDAAVPNPLAVLRDVPVLHWHGDTFDLPEGCALLASTPLCTNQAFSRGPNVLGLQFHPEVLGVRFEHWLLGHANELATAGVSPIKLRSDARRYAAGLEQAAAALLTGWLSRLTI